MGVVRRRLNSARREAGGLSIRGEERTFAFAYLSPTLLLILALVAYPLVYSLLLTVTGRNKAGEWLGGFVGAANYLQLFQDPVFLQSLVQTIEFIVPACVFAVAMGLAAALVLAQDFVGNRIVRATLLIPWALPPVVVAAMFQWLLDSRRGILGYYLVQLGLMEKSPLFLGGIPWTLYTLMGIHVWKTFPLLGIMFLVALQYLPRELIQSAKIDGASAWQRFRRIVLPHLLPTLVAGLVIQLLFSVQVFDLILALTSGGPGKYSTYNLYFYAYKNTFEYNNYGYGAVLAYVVAVIVVLFALIVTRRQLRTGLA